MVFPSIFTDKSKLISQNNNAFANIKIKVVGVMNNSQFFKGIGTGIIIGAGLTMLMDPVTDRQRHKLVKKTEGMFKNMGEMVDAVVGMFK